MSSMVTVRNESQIRRFGVKCQNSFSFSRFDTFTFTEFTKLNITCYGLCIIVLDEMTSTT